MVAWRPTRTVRRISSPRARILTRQRPVRWRWRATTARPRVGIRTRWQRRRPVGDVVHSLALSPRPQRSRSRARTRWWTRALVGSRSANRSRHDGVRVAQASLMTTPSERRPLATKRRTRRSQLQLNAGEIAAPARRSEPCETTVATGVARPPTVSVTSTVIPRGASTARKPRPGWVEPPISTIPAAEAELGAARRPSASASPTSSFRGSESMAAEPMVKRTRGRQLGCPRWLTAPAPRSGGGC